jgi:hypothetical protein
MAKGENVPAINLCELREPRGSGRRRRARDADGKARGRKAAMGSVD